MVKALKSLSEFYSSELSTEETKRHLRSSLEHREVRAHKRFLQAFKQINCELDLIDENVSNLQRTCLEVSKKLHAVRLTTSHLVQQTHMLQEKKVTLETQTVLVETFLTRFQLSESDATALEKDDIEQPFFNSLNRIIQIRKDCSGLLLAYQQQRVALDIMDSLAERLECAYERLYRWVQKKSQQMTGLRDVDTNFFTAFNLLKQMPLYFQHCTQELCQTRRLLLVRQFLSSLTLGGSHGTRSIDSQAADPQRYVNDIFAWIHQAVASEREYVSALFVISNFDTGTYRIDFISDGKESPAASSSIGPSEAEQALQIMASIFEGVSRPLKIRIEQAISSRPGLIVSFKLWNLIGYYSEAIGHFFPPLSSVRETLNGLHLSSKKVVFDLLEKQTMQFKHALTYSHDLSPPRAIIDMAQQLRDLLDLSSQSFTSSQDLEANISSVLTTILDPLLEVTTRSAQNLSVSDAAVFQINIMDLLQSTLQQHEQLTATRLELLLFTCSQNIDRLVMIARIDLF
jgi:hypothetical protein